MSRKRKLCADVALVHASQGNLFSDLGRPDAEESMVRIRLAQKIAEIIERLGMSQKDAAARMGLDQPKVSALVHGRLSGFSTDRLLRCLTALGQDVQIVVRDKPSNSSQAHISVAVAAYAKKNREFKSSARGFAPKD